jgi:hypothetical protein
VWCDKLPTTANNELFVADLKLTPNEYVTDFRVEFGTVEPDFQETEAPYILTRVLDDLPKTTLCQQGRCGRKMRQGDRLKHRFEGDGRVPDRAWAASPDGVLACRADGAEGFPLRTVFGFGVRL